MADRSFKPLAGSLTKGVAMLCGEWSFGADGVVASGSRTYGFTAGTVDSDGIQTLTLNDRVNRLLGVDFLVGRVFGDQAFGATTTSASTTVTGLSSTVNLVEGQSVAGTNIPSGATIASIGSSSIVLSDAATGSGTVTLTFGTVAELADQATVVELDENSASSASREIKVQYLSLKTGDQQDRAELNGQKVHCMIWLKLSSVGD